MTTKVAKMTSSVSVSSTSTFPTTTSRASSASSASSNANNAANTTEDSKIDSFMISASSDGTREKDRTMSTGDVSINTCTSSTSASTVTTTSSSSSNSAGASVTHGFITEHSWSDISRSNSSASDNIHNNNFSTKQNVNEHIIPMVSSKKNSQKSSSSSSSSTALDALAFFAANVHNNLSTTTLTTTTTSTNTTNNSDQDSEMMPPPPPRMKGRARSASNPEGMEKWDSYSYFRHNGFTPSSSSNPSSSWSSKSSIGSARRHFVLPTSILEEELAEVNETCKVHAEQKKLEEMTHFMDSSSLSKSRDQSYVDIHYDNHSSSRKQKNEFVPSVRRGMTIFSVNQSSNGENDEDSDMYGTSPTTVMTQENGSSGSNRSKSTLSSSSLLEAKKRKTKKACQSSTYKYTSNYESNDTLSSSSINNDNNDHGDDDDNHIEPLEDESNLEPEELLRRARNKLFEDLSCAENCGLNKGVVPFPHSLDKYKEVRGY